MAKEQLTQKAVNDRIAAGTPGKFGDGGSLFLVVRSEGNATWILRARWREPGEVGAGKVRDFRIGAAGPRNKGLVDLTLARSRAELARNLISDGVDPRRSNEPEQPKPAGPTFADLVPDVIADQTRDARHVKTEQQWRAYLGETDRDLSKVRDVAAAKAHVDALKALRSKPIADATLRDVAAVLRPIWTITPSSAERCRQRIEAVFAYAISNDYRTEANPAEYDGRLEHVLRRPKVVARHYDAVPYRELPNVYQRLCDLPPGMSHACLRFAILTASRPGEARGVRWSELDLSTSTWTIEPERTKTLVRHREPLSRQAVEILEQMRLWRRPGSRDGYVFLGRVEGKPLSNTAMNLVLRRLSIEATSHGFRSTFRDWTAEETDYPNEVCEMALSHAIKDKTEAAYRRGDLFEKRRKLMQDWANYVTSASNPQARMAKKHK